MAYTTTTTMAVGDIFTASRWNAEVKSNFDTLATLANDGTLYWDNTTKGLGSGTATPTAKFHAYRTDGNYQYKSQSASRVYGWGTAVDDFFLDDVTAPARRLTLTAAGVITLAGTLTVNSAPLTVGTFKLPLLVGRMGGSSTVWNTTGTTQQNTPDGVIQLGSFAISIGASGIATTAISFHTTFTNVPLVFISVEATANSFPYVITTKSTTGFSVFISNITGGTVNFNVNWLAIGPR